MNLDENWYEILDLSQTASVEEIKQAYFEKARQYHPDTNPSELAKEWFLRVQQAYEVLSHPEKRKDYDKVLQKKSPPIDQIQIRTQLSTNTIQNINEPQMLYAMLELSSLAKTEKIKRPICHVCLVIDKSTSMKGRRINMIAENIVKLTNQLNENDLLSIITFNDKAEILLTPTPLEQINQIYEKITTIHCSGGTEIYHGLKAGADILWGNHSQSGYSQLILFTDGQTYGDEEACLELANKIHTKGVKINTVGIGHEWNDVFLDRLAGKTGGNTTFVSSSKDLSSFIQDFSNSLSQKIAGNVTLDIQLKNEIELKFLFRLHPEVTELLVEKPIALGDLYHQKNSVFLAAFVIPPLKGNEKELILAEGKIRFEIYEPERRKFSQSIVIKTENRPEQENSSRAMVEALSRISIYQMQEKANAEVRAGQIDQAVNRLGSVSTQLFKLGISDVAQKVINEAQLLKNSQKYSLEGDKQLKYGTRALIAQNLEESMI